MSSFNKSILMGNLVRDPETRHTQSGMAVVNATLAINDKRKVGEEWVDEVCFIDITIFGKRGEAFAKFHSGGKPAFVEGKIKLDRWDAKDGSKRSKHYIIVDNWEFVGGGKQEQGQSRADFNSGKEAPPMPTETGMADFLEADDTPF